jgi:hypothetical protein
MSPVQLFAGVSIAILVSACAANRVNTDLRGAVVRVEPDSVLLEQSPDMTRFKVSVIIRNDRSTPLYFGGCGPVAEEEINGKWETVWSPVCISPQGGLVNPGDSVTFPFAADRFAQDVYPRLDPRAGPGRYRLLFGATYQGPPTPGNFVVRSGPTPPPVTLSELVSPVFVVYSR